MDPQSLTESATVEPTLHAMAMPAPQAPAALGIAAHEQDLISSDFEEWMHAALEGISEDLLPTSEADDAGATTVEASADEAEEDSLEAVELELALHNQNIVSLGFEESIRTALEEVGGELLFQMRVENEDCQRIAAVRVGQGQEQQFALVIMPPGGGPMRVEPVAQSTNPLAMITESYAGLVDVFRAAA